METSKAVLLLLPHETGMDHPTEQKIEHQSPNHSDVESRDASDFLDPAECKALTRRVDLQILPIIMLMTTFSFLDRVNIGNARIMGLERDLKLKGNQYQIAVSIFFVTYCLSEVPSNMLLKRLKPNRYLPCLALAFGTIASSTGAVQNFGGLAVVRVTMGIFEAGLMPGSIVYLTMFYTRSQIALRIACQFIATAIAGALGGIVAYGVESGMEGVAGLSAWRWLMILEGLPSIIVGVVAFFVLPEKPENAHFLSPERRALLVRMRRSEVGQTAAAQEMDRKDVWAAIKDWQIWVFCLASFMTGIMFYGIATFLPTIVHTIGDWTSAESNALTVPVYAVAGVVYLCMARVSDRTHLRGPYAAGFCLLTIAGVIMLLSQSGPAVSYAGTFVIVAGMYTASGLPLAWLPGNKPRWGKRAFASAIHGVFANFAGAVMPFLYPKKNAPAYVTAYSTSLALLVGAMGIFIFLSWYYGRVNRRRAEGKEDWKLLGKTEEEIEMMGDYSPKYVYTT